MCTTDLGTRHILFDAASFRFTVTSRVPAVFFLSFFTRHRRVASRVVFFQTCQNNLWYRVINTELSSQNLFELTLQFFAMLHSLRGESILKTLMMFLQLQEFLRITILISFL